MKFTQSDKWEYHGVYFDLADDTADDLNLLGKEGWELVSTVPVHNPGAQLQRAYFVFKRKK